MKSTSFSHVVGVVLFASMTCHSAWSRSITEFSPEENQRLEWRVVDDGVMGGLSRGKAKFTSDGTLDFSGILSLENNGGFSSLRTKRMAFDLSAYEGVAMRVKGDGRRYQLRLTTDERYRGMEISFKAEFPTEKEKWTEVKVPFEAFEASFRGWSLPDRKFNPAKVQRLGLLLGDKKAGPFVLQVDWIRGLTEEKASNEAPSLVEAVLADERFSTLATALKQADLVSALQGEGPFTVLAPTDEAFSRLPEGTLENLLQDGAKGTLQDILKLHVIAGKVLLPDALAAGEASSLQGQSVRFSFRDGRVRVNDASLLSADVGVSNGVIHVIDQVLLPKASGGKAPAAASQPISMGKAIMGAIEKGVPLYNRGDAAACAEVYEGCIREMAVRSDLDDALRQHLLTVLDHGVDERDADRQAWLYRHALDATLMRVVSRR